MPITAGRPATPNDVRANEVRNHEAGMLLIGVGAILLLVTPASFLMRLPAVEMTPNRSTGVR